MRVKNTGSFAVGLQGSLEVMRGERFIVQARLEVEAKKGAHGRRKAHEEREATRGVKPFNELKKTKILFKRAHLTQQQH